MTTPTGPRMLVIPFGAEGMWAAYCPFDCWPIKASSPGEAGDIGREHAAACGRWQDWHRRMELVDVVTRYGWCIHRAPAPAPINWPTRTQTICRGVSAWTLASWWVNPDHPLLTIEQIEALPRCEGCAEIEAKMRGSTLRARPLRSKTHTRR